MEKIALVTGSSRGIGRAAVRKLAAAGYAVCINYRERQDCADALVEELHPDGIYERLTEEIARDKMLADRDEEGMAELFTKCGVYVDQDEAFYVEPKKEKED